MNVHELRVSLLFIFDFHRSILNLIEERGKDDARMTEATPHAWSKELMHVAPAFVYALIITRG